MLDDAYQDICDTLIVVSGDSDLVPAVHVVKARFPEKRVVVYVPARDATRGAATEMRAAGDKSATLPMQLFKFCQLPPEVRDGNDRPIRKPASW
jgi:uncharacterized LabA/DUF88 family protein